MPRRNLFQIQWFPSMPAGARFDRMTDDARIDAKAARLVALERYADRPLDYLAEAGRFLRDVY